MKRLFRTTPFGNRGGVALYCALCGSGLPEKANFCPCCGAACCLAALDGGEGQWEECEIVFASTGESGLLFPKDKGRFQAQLAGAELRCIARTQEFTLGCLTVEGPDPADKKQRRVLGELDSALTAAGWTLCAKQGRYWYSRVYGRKKGGRDGKTRNGSV